MAEVNFFDDNLSMRIGTLSRMVILEGVGASGGSMDCFLSVREVRNEEDWAGERRVSWSYQ